MKRILLVNPNTNTTTTASMVDYAKEALQGEEFDVYGTTVSVGPPMLVDEPALNSSVPYVVDTVQQHLAEAPFDAVMIAAIGDPGYTELKALLSVPVVGIGESAILEAAGGDTLFAMATSTHLLASSLTKLVGMHGQSHLFKGVFLTSSDPLLLANNPEQQFQELRQAVDAALQAGAQKVIIAGGPLSATARRLSAEPHLAGRIVAPVPSACRRIRQLSSE